MAALVVALPRIIIELLILTMIDSSIKMAITLFIPGTRPVIHDAMQIGMCKREPLPVPFRIIRLRLCIPLNKTVDYYPFSNAKKYFFFLP
jgi:hypothetical protein